MVTGDSICVNSNTGRWCARVSALLHNKGKLVMYDMQQYEFPHLHNHLCEAPSESDEMEKSDSCYKDLFSSMFKGLYFSPFFLNDDE